MEVQTARFGFVEYAADDVLRFPEGLPGLAGCRDWVILAGRHGDAVAWMQCVSHPEVALAVVAPRRFVPGYQLRVAPRELEPLWLDSLESAWVLAIVSRTERSLSVNLKAPVVVNARRRLGRQVIGNGDLPLRHPLTVAVSTLGRTA